MRSGAPSASGVGRHRTITSASASGPGFALNTVPGSSVAISESVTSPIVERPSLNASIFSALASTPITGYPARAMASRSGRPT